MWSRVTIADIEADWFVPERHRTGRTILLLPHYLGFSATWETDWVELLNRAECACFVPRTQACWWVDRVQDGFLPNLSPEAWLLDETVLWLRRSIGGTSFGILGVGTGGHAALRLAFRHATIFSTAASIAGLLDMQDWYGRGLGLEEIYPSKEACRHDSAILRLDPARFPEAIRFSVDMSDPSWRGNDRLSEKLTANGLPHEAVFTTLGLNEIEAYTRVEAGASLAFVTAALDRIGKRLL